MLTTADQDSNGQCLNKLKRSLHSEVTSKTKVQMTSIAKCPVLLCSRQFTFSKILLQTLQLEALFTIGFFKKKLDYETKNRPVTLMSADDANVLRHLLARH
jgi:hypothetical protein